MRKPKNWLTYTKAMSKICGQDVLPDVKLTEQKPRKKRAKETKPRNMEEKKLELDIIIALSLRGIVVAKRGETSTYNSKHCLDGTSDLEIFIPDCGNLYMEVKPEKYRNLKNGGLRDSQVEFRDLCYKCHLRHVVVYSVDEALAAVKKF